MILLSVGSAPRLSSLSEQSPTEHSVLDASVCGCVCMCVCQSVSVETASIVMDGLTWAGTRAFRGPEENLIPVRPPALRYSPRRVSVVL